MMKRFVVITLFPEMFEPVLGSSMMWKAQKDQKAEFQLINLRDYGLGPRRQVDDKPFGGGVGMLLMIEPLAKAIERARQILPRAKVLLMTPAKTVWDQKQAWLHAERDEKISVGRYVLTGGELPAMIVIDSIVRLLPGVLGGGDEATVIESYSQLDALEYPQYTRPEEYEGKRVPEVLLSGNHALIGKWRREHQIDLSADS